MFNWLFSWHTKPMKKIGRYYGSGLFYPKDMYIYEDDAGVRWLAKSATANFKIPYEELDID